jgi:N-methylhydantoinase A
MTHVIAVDSGGTFTDCVVVDGDGNVTTAKSGSTPADFSVGVLAAVTRAAQALGLGLEELLPDTDLFAHGTTVATNVLLTRSGPRVGLITTKGHEDALIIGRTIQKAAGLVESELTNLARLEKANPIVPRPLIKGVTERVDYKGAVIVPLELEEARRAAAELVAAGVEAIAICFLWSFLLPEHEQAVQKMITTEHPGVFVSSSHEVAPVIKEYERGASTVLNAYLSRDTFAYISALQDKLAAAGLRHDPVIMQSVGGVTSAADAKGHAVSLLSSGPAGGVLGAAALGELIGSANVITTDVGGTSFDVGLVVDGGPAITSVPVFDKYHTVLPVLDVTSIGAGGGSIAWIEPGTGHLKVGPQSAGADPGPACYGLGGQRPTVTDANVVLGRIDPGYFLGGTRSLRADLAEAAIREHVATALGVSVVEAAMGIVDILDARMADLVRMETIGRGYDPREFALFAFGGAGPLHVGAYGVEIGAKPIVVPAHSSVFSAYGIAGSDLVRVHQSSDPMIAPFDPERLTAVFSRMEQATLADLVSKGLKRDAITTYREVELRFRGQVHEVRVPVPPGDLGGEQVNEILADFEQRYNRRYGRGAAYRKAGIEARTFLVRGVGRLLRPQQRPALLGAPDPAAARTGERPVYFGEFGAFAPTPVYRREMLKPGNVVAGPAIIEAIDTTVLLHPGQSARADGWSNLLLESS